MQRLVPLLAALAAAAVLEGCATAAGGPSAEQVAACEKMAGMSEAGAHDHTRDRTGMANPMGLTHAQCRSLLRR